MNPRLASIDQTSRGQRSGESRRWLRGIASRSVDCALPLAGTIGWVLVPKCPLCLIAYFGMASGITLSLGEGQAVRYAFILGAISLMLFGLWRIVKRTRRVSPEITQYAACCGCCRE